MISACTATSAAGRMIRIVRSPTTGATTPNPRWGPIATRFVSALRMANAPLERHRYVALDVDGHGRQRGGDAEADRDPEQPRRQHVVARIDADHADELQHVHRPEQGRRFLDGAEEALLRNLNTTLTPTGCRHSR